LVALLILPVSEDPSPHPPRLNVAGAKLGASAIAIGDPVLPPLLLRGFYESEGGWRWTARPFAVAITPPAGNDSVSSNLPIEVTRTIPAVVLTARVNRVEVRHKRYAAEGRHEFSAPVPDRLLPANQPAEIEFELDRAAHDDGRNRELALIALSAALTHSPTARFDREEETARATNICSPNVNWSRHPKNSTS
jgi:hypothetical protein